MDFTKLEKYLDGLRREHVPGCDIAVYQDHRLLYRHQAGYRDEAGESPVRPDDTYWLYSATKLFTTCAAMQLIRQGKISLDDPVGDYLPAYRHLTVKTPDGPRPARRTLTVRHLMSMQSGMTYDLESPSVKAALKARPDADTRTLVDAMAGEPLEFEPGENFLYSLSHDVLAAVIEEAGGKRFSDYLQKHVFSPLGLKTMDFSIRRKERQSAQYFWHPEEKRLIAFSNEENRYRLSPRYESGGAGLTGDVEDYALFADALACGGETKDGKEILAPEMIQLWRANQLGPVSRVSFDTWNRKGYSYALGVRTRVDLALGGPGSLGEFGWDGAAGAWTMVDPARRLSAFFAMHVHNHPTVYDVIHPTLRALIYEGIDAP
ncbi:MAG: beta-lactamase family protein [Clostridiales bacterium]|nr:beta-lactamase family protein [Clostridiales bacterium]